MYVLIFSYPSCELNYQSIIDKGTNGIRTTERKTLSQKVVDNERERKRQT